MSQYAGVKRYDMKFLDKQFYLHTQPKESKTAEDGIAVSHNDPVYNKIFNMLSIVHPDYEENVGKKPVGFLSFNRYIYEKITQQNLLDNFEPYINKDGDRKKALFYENGHYNKGNIKTILKPEISTFKLQLSTALTNDYINCKLIEKAGKSELVHSCLEILSMNHSANAIMEYKICLGISAHIYEATREGELKCKQMELKDEELELLLHEIEEEQILDNPINDGVQDEL